MHITKNADVVNITTKPGAGKDGSPTLVVHLAIPVHTLDTSQAGELLRYRDHEVTITLSAPPLPDPNHKPMDAALEAAQLQKGLDNAVPERMKPLAHERCAICNREISADFTADFLTPIAGPPRPVHGVCKEIAERDGEAQAELAMRGEASTTPVDGVDTPGSADGATIEEGPQQHGDDEGSQEPRRGRGNGVARVVRL